MVLEKVKAILAEQFDVEEDKITADTDLQEDLGADSLDVVDLLMSIEDEFEIEIPDDEIENIKTVGALVSYIEANSVRINLLSKSMSKVVMSNFLEFAKRPIKVSLGSFSGIAMLSGYGPKLAFNVNPFGEVICYFSSSFESAGINQTYHKLYLIISIKVYVVFPFRKLVINSSSEVLLCETLIIGKIPEVYLNSGKLTEMLNLVPEKFTT